LRSIINKPLLLTIFNNDIIMKQKNDIIKQPMKNINTMKIMKKFLFLKICLLALYSPTIFAITCSTGGGSGGGDSATYTWSKIRSDGDANGYLARYAHSSVNFDGKMWVMGGSDSSRKNDVWSSTNGKTWIEATKDSSAKFSARLDHTSVVFDDGNGEKIWVIGGDGGGRQNDVWSSADGKTWTTATDSAQFVSRRRHQAVVFKDVNDGNIEKMWVIGGEFSGSNLLNDVWSSVDGKTWTKVRGNGDANGFPARQRHQVVVFNDGKGEKMWVLGGNNGSNLLNDVWSSADGITWDEVTTSTNFPIRDNFAMVNFDSKLWVIGGDDKSDVLNDIWSSTNGITWTEEKAAGFVGRYKHSAVVSNKRLWVTGGFDRIVGLGQDPSQYTLDDAWSLSKD
jgi:dihydrofolate reductase